MSNFVLYGGAYPGPKVDEAVSRALTGGAIDQSIAALRGAVGAPLVAAAVADMTDTSKVYVYTGSEAGYTAGNWYYWDGAAWTSGGVYNAVAVNTDTTLSVPGMAADAKATGDAIAGIGVNEINRRILAAFPAERSSGHVAFTAAGADGIPVKALAVSDVGDYAVAPDVFIPTAAPHAVAAQNSLSASPRCIIFPCVGLTPCTVTVSASATLRIASFPDYPGVGSTPSNYAAASGTTVSITPLAGDKWILAQLLADADGKTLADVTGAGFGVSPAPVWITDVIRRSGKNLAPAATLTGYWGSSGALASGGTHTPCFPVVAGGSYAWSVQTANANNTYLVWYDETFTKISVAADQRRLNANMTSVVLTAPAGAAWASLSFRAAQGALQFERAAAATAIEAHVETASELTIAAGTIEPELTSVLGPTTVWADAGDVDVTFYCDPTLYIAAQLGGA